LLRTAFPGKIRGEQCEFAFHFHHGALHIRASPIGFRKQIRGLGNGLGRAVALQQRPDGLQGFEQRFEILARLRPPAP
jgi:hypothetical protein